MNFNWKESSALISGGASGLGLAVVKNFIRLGAQVAVLDLPKPETQAQLAQISKNIYFFPTDITQPQQIKNSLQQLKAQLNFPLRIVVNCAGIVFSAKVLKKNQASDLEIFSKTININLIGTFDVCRQAAELMAQNEVGDQNQRGIIINTASIAAFEGQIGQSAYAASKAGIVGMTLPLARDLASSGIRVNAIAPGIFDTPMLHGLPEAAQKSLIENVPFPHRLGKPDEFAALAQHIVENTMINGEVIRLDAALRMGMK